MATQKGNDLMAAPTPGELAVHVDEHEKRLKRNDDDHKDIWKMLDKIQNRLPHWALLLISLLSAATAALVRSLF